MAKARLKTPALSIPVPSTRDDCAIAIRTLGDQLRLLARVETELNDRIAEIAVEYEPRVNTLKASIQAMQTGIQTWCEANRPELTEDGKRKSGHFTTGDVQWRQRPPSITVRGVEAVLAWLDEKKLDRFIRVKKEVNKDAMLNEPAIAEAVPGVTVVSGVEDFVITPFEQEVA